MLHLHQLRVSVNSALGALVFLAFSFVTPASGQAPSGYYNSVDPSSSATLRATLNAVIDDHQLFSYSGGATDTLDILKLADQDPSNSANILDVYHNKSYAKSSGSFNREHSWPKSFGFPSDNGQNYPYVDCHQLFLCDTNYNSARANFPFASGNSSWSELSTLFNDGAGGGSGVYPGNSDWFSNSAQSFEVWKGRRGDIARAMFYMDVRYEGGNHGVTGWPEPNLILTDNTALMYGAATGSNESVAYMGLLSVLLAWHAEDPVDAKESARNNAVFGFQGNRNPFTDHPEWVACLFGGGCVSDTLPPAVPTGLVATGGDSVVTLDWADNTEPDFAGYRVYRGTAPGGPYSQTGNLATSSSFSDSGLTNGMTLYYTVTAEDFSGNESGASQEANATPVSGGTGGGGSGDPWINELHYDNGGADVGEFIEVAGPAGLSLTGYTLVAYNGSGGLAYSTILLSGTLTDMGGCVGATSYSLPGFQNGAPDGIALVDPLGVVIEFLSYEGSFTANDGPATGMTSTDIGVSEDSLTLVGESLQLGGVGAASTDFTWQSALAETPGMPNQGQGFSGGCLSACGFTAYSLGASPANTIGLIGVGGAGTGTMVDIVATSVPGLGTFDAISLGPSSLPLLGGVVLIDPFQMLLPIHFVVGLTGTTTWSLPIPAGPTFAGLSVYFQAFALDATQPGGYALSNGLELIICP
jgi:endonuclease I